MTDLLGSDSARYVKIIQLPSLHSRVRTPDEDATYQVTEVGLPFADVRLC